MAERQKAGSAEAEEEDSPPLYDVSLDVPGPGFFQKGEDRLVNLPSDMRS